VYYSMFGMQRIGDLVWAAADQRAKGFLIGATAGRTTLAGEGLQHQDGNSLVQAYPVPNLKTYDPAFAFELAVIVEDGIRRMYVENEDIFYYVTVENENYVQLPMPDDHARVREGVIRGMYRLNSGAAPTEEAGKKSKKDGKSEGLRAQLLGSGPSMSAVLKAQQMLTAYGVTADVWSVTSYKELHQDALLTERDNMLHPEREPKVSFAAAQLSAETAPGVIVAVSDYIKLLADSLSGHVGRKVWTLGTDGWGRSEAREELRDFFEVDARYIVVATLYALMRDGKVGGDVVQKAIAEHGIDPERLAPVLR